MNIFGPLFWFGDFLLTQFTRLLFYIDALIYTCISTLYKLIFYISNVELITNSTIQDLISRIYVLLGVFMLFKVAFSMIQYLVDPESFSDQSKGFGKLIVNVMVSLVLLVAMPYIFKYAYKLQGIIIEEGVINRLIFGERFVETSKHITGITGSDDNHANSVKAVERMGKDIEFAMFSGFFQLNAESTSLTACTKQEYPNSTIIGSSDMAANEDCLNAFLEVSKKTMQSQRIGMTDFFKYIDSNGNVVDSRRFSSFGPLLDVKDSDDIPIVNYHPIISTLVGGYLLLLLVTFCIDIAARVFKLTFLQMISPIAIISYVDPKESMNDGTLSRWIKETLSTFLSLFIRLAVIFLVIKLGEILCELISKPTGLSYYDNLGPDPSDTTINWLVFVALVLGVFSFAKEVPKQIENIFHLDNAGSLQLNPIKALDENMGFRMGRMGLEKGLGMGLGGTLGTVLSGKASYTAARASGKGRLASLGSAGGGAVSGGVQGLIKGVNTHGMKETADASLDIAGRTSARTALYASQGVSAINIPKKVGLAWERTADKHGVLTKGDIWKNRLTGYQNVVSTGKTLKNDIDERAKKSQNIYMDGKTYKQYFDDLDLEQKIVEKRIKADMTEKEREDIRKSLKGIEDQRKEAIKLYTTRSASDESFDSQIHKEIKNYEQHVTKVFGKKQDVNSQDDIKKVIETSERKINEIQSDSKKTEAIERSEAVSENARQIAQGIYNSNSDRILRGPGGPGGHGGPPIGGDS